MLRLVLGSMSSMEASLLLNVHGLDEGKLGQNPDRDGQTMQAWCSA